ncbi:hypothetical protein O6H91_03G128800 [Diphasiastrum complanatum]|uniref:Uncharacterized protein n=1 Tax=Diphasiastrum complanatum TaxID=34168 RepID=A0ACC2EC24_DIPCM|nr:hypothetical protein O6H91_03G128800 [Diphasiastrum complanatum]
MAEIQEGVIMAADAVKLFVGQIPKHFTQEQLLTVFREAGNVCEINIIKDKATKQSRGCCFLTYATRKEADNAINSFHNKRTIAPVNSPLQVKYADGELERLEHKLFIGMLPKSASDADIKAVFSRFGTIKELQVVRGSQQATKGCAFLKYETKEQAMAAIEAINGIHKMEGSTTALVVKWADTEKERQARKVQKSQAITAGAVTGIAPQQPSLFGAVPQGYIANTTPFNGYAYQAAGAYGMLPYAVPAVQNQAMNIPGLGTTNLTPVQSVGYLNSGYANVTGLQYPLAYQGALVGQGVVNPTYGTTGTAVSLSPAAVAASTQKTNVGPQVEGPPGANLFIYHIPQEYGDLELLTAFSSFGTVISAKVFVDKATGISKCFGFVSYATPEAAQAAINVMNGFQLGGKRLKVQLKRDNKQSKPY